jgi:hypothetical protein
VGKVLQSRADTNQYLDERGFEQLARPRCIPYPERAVCLLRWKGKANRPIADSPSLYVLTLQWNRIVPSLNSQLAEILLAAYRPCPAFTSVCAEMRWAPEDGHVPRGFCGAAGSLEQVLLVLVCAEPGDPHPTERHVGGTPEDLLRSAYNYAYECLRSQKDPFHRKMRLILDLCWPGLPFEVQLERVWMVDSVLCSARIESGPVSIRAARQCRGRYLERQLALMPHALVVALGGKAYARTKGVQGVLRAYAAAPPGCNYRGARESWEHVARLVRSRTS